MDASFGIVCFVVVVVLLVGPSLWRRLRPPMKELSQPPMIWELARARAQGAIEQFDLEHYGIHPVQGGLFFSVDGHTALFSTIDDAFEAAGWCLTFGIEGFGYLYPRPDKVEAK